MSLVKNQAKRGDLAIIESRHRDHFMGQDARERSAFAVCVVTSITRDGVVKAVRRTGYGDTIQPIAHWVGFHVAHIVPQTKIDVDGALEAARQHTWPDHPDQPKYYDTLDEVRDALRPHLNVAVRGTDAQPPSAPIVNVTLKQQRNLLQSCL